MPGQRIRIARGRRKDLDGQVILAQGVLSCEQIDCRHMSRCLHMCPDVDAGERVIEPCVTVQIERGIVAVFCEAYSPIEVPELATVEEVSCATR